MKREDREYVSYTKCWQCNGTGEVRSVRYRPDPDCKECNGTGETWDEHPHNGSRMAVRCGCVKGWNEA